jgi:hypothetical protein
LPPGAYHPDSCIILDTAFNILAQNGDHATATLSATKNVVGRNLFEAFPDNPYDSGSMRGRRTLIPAECSENAQDGRHADRPL